jgi:spermidine/putrescine-binding protein
MIKAKSITICILLTFLLAAFAGSILAVENITIVGVITEDGLIVDKKGVIYEIGENDNFEAVTKNTDVKVEVKGMVEEDEGGNKIIMIESFKVLK